MQFSACGGWLSTHGLPPSKSRWSTVESAEYSLRMEKSRLITTTSHEPSQFNSIEWKIQNFYQSCMSLGFIESDREKPLLKIINSLGGWNVLRSFNLYSWDSHRVLRELHSEHYVNAFFEIGVVHDASDPSSARSIIKISPAGLGMSDRSYYHRLPDDPAVQAYQTFMKDSAQLFGASSPEAHKFSVDIFNFEKRISEITPDSEYLRDPVKTNNRMTVKDLHTMSMNIPWLEILKAAYSDAPMSEETEVVVASPQYAADIAVIMSTTDRASLNNYLMWQLVQVYMPYLSKQFREVLELYRKTLTGAQKPLERWEMCEITTERFFGHLMNAMFFRQEEKKNAVLVRERQPLAQKLFDYIKHNVAKSLSVSEGYDYASRRAAMAKLKNMTVQIGTPDFLLDRQYLKLMYNHLLVQKSDFFQNIQYGVIFLRKREEFSLVSPGEESRWLDRLNDNGVSYSPTGNKVILPEVMLLPPFFHPGYPNSINLGGLGVRMAEAVISGVVGYGLLYDVRGVLQYPGGVSAVAAGHMTNTSAIGVVFTEPLLAFDRVTQCLNEKYSELGVDTPDYLNKCRVSSAMSVSAVRQTVITLEDMLELETGQLLPAMETQDPQSLFFLSYAQSLCSKRTFKQRDIDRTTSHGWDHRDELLDEERLEGTLSQLPQFRHFFFCTSLSEETNCGNIV
jgi:predicted metalloendopeptidase